MFSCEILHESQRAAGQMDSLACPKFDRCFHGATHRLKGPVQCEYIGIIRSSKEQNITDLTRRQKQEL